MIHWIGSPNYSKTRYTIRGIVLHLIDDDMDNNIAGTDHWFRQEASGVSSHYAIAGDGQVHQYVHESNSAYHAGRVYMPTWSGIERTRSGYVNPNLYTVGIEHEGRPEDEWPRAMLEASMNLVADICRRHHIVPSRKTIAGHREIRASKACPGSWLDLDKYVSGVAQVLAAAV